MRVIISTMLFIAALLVQDNQTALGVDLSKIDRQIAKEPEYQSTSPGYCLLVFGLEARTRLWLVIDDSIVYFDRNGNGDLTEEGERISGSGYGVNRLRFSIGDVVEADGATTHRNLVIIKDTDSRFKLRIRTADGIYRSVGEEFEIPAVKPRLAATPNDAPIIHPNGPITFARYGLVNFVPRTASNDVEKWLRLIVGSAGVGPGTFTIVDACEDVGLGCDDGQKLEADLRFPARDPDAPPIVVKQKLETDG